MTGTVLVTGGAGYIGSHACKALKHAGFEPVAYDDLSRGHGRAVQWGPIEVGDVLDGVRLKAVLNAHRPVAVLHFAGLAYVQESIERPLDYYRVNVGGSAILLEAMRAADVHRIVFSSSCAVYGIAEAAVGEDAPAAPISPYGASKAMIERMLEDAGRAHGLRWTALRYFNAAGADPDGEIGEDHDPEPHLIPRALMAAAGEIDAVDICGTDYATPDGTAVRDYIHVSDLARAHVLALEALLNDGPRGVFNLGSGRGMSVSEVIAAVERVSGRPVPTVEKPRRPGDPPSMRADAGRAASELGFTPDMSDPVSIIDSAWRWRLKRHNSE